jgi:hypothetical protein
MHASPVVHAFPSLHGVPLATGVGAGQLPDPGSQVPATLHWSPPPQDFMAPLWHEPPMHASPTVQALLSLQDVPLGSGGFEHSPVSVLHTPTPWHWSLAVHDVITPLWHEPPMHASPVVQAFPSLHGVPSARGLPEHVPVAELQPSWPWQGTAGHETGLPPLQVPPWQVSVCVQALLSLHGVPSVTGVCMQPLAATQLSAVHGLLSSHEMLALAQTPPEQRPFETWHMSVTAQALPSAFWQLPVPLQALQAPHPLLVQQNPSVQNAPATH